MIAAQGLLPAFVRGWGLLKQCCVRNAIPTTEPKAILLFFFAPTCTSFILTTPLPQDYRLRKLSLRTVLPLSLSARMAPDDAHVKHLFVLNPLVRERTFARSSPFRRSPSYDCALLWRRLPHLYRAGKGVTLQSRNLEFYCHPDCDCKRRLTVTHT